MPPTDPEVRVRTRVLRMLLGWLGLALLTTTWAITTPVGASPDEPAHLVKAASVVRGQFVGEPIGAAGMVVQVPRYIAWTHAQTCFAFEPDVTADCIPPVPGDPAELVDGTTTAGLYNPMYYLLTGWPTLVFGDETGIVASRIVSGVLVAGLLTVAASLLLAARRGPIVAIGVVTAITPMTLFLGGTVNPNGLENAAVLVAFAAAFAMLSAPERLVRPAAIALAVSVVIAANLRGLSLLWLGVALVLPLFWTVPGRLRALAARTDVRVLAAIAVVGGVLAAIWLVGTNSLGSAIDDPGDSATVPGVGTHGVLGFIWTLSATFEYGQGLVGIFGWLDTPAPLAVQFLWSLLIGGVALLGIVLARGRARIAVWIGIGAVLLLPAILQGIYIASGGVIWQGRYILPVFVCAVMACTLAAQSAIDSGDGPSTATIHSPAWSSALAWLAGAWAIAQVLSIALAIRRYAVGLSAGWGELLDPAWSPPGGIALWLVVAAIGAGVAVIVLPRAARPLPLGAR